MLIVKKGLLPVLKNHKKDVAMRLIDLEELRRQEKLQ
jgi:hypothetical protein